MMKVKAILLAIFLIGLTGELFCQSETFGFKANVFISKEVREFFNSNGRLFIFLSVNPNSEPRMQTFPLNKCHFFARNFTDLNSSKVIRINGSEGWNGTSDWTLENVPSGEYFVQVLWDQDNTGYRINAPGNLYSEKQKIDLNKSTKINITVNKIITTRKIEEHELIKEINIKSDTLSIWWGRPVYLKASVLLPSLYKKGENKAYPIRYNIAGFGGRYTRINWLFNDDDFFNWWNSDDAPQIINVFLDGYGPFGDSYQMDSDNSGPYGYALINELIPYIESKYRGTNSSNTRFVDGCSTGGWVSLGLQLFYPHFFNGSFSYSPDAVEFENFQLINIYKDKNAFLNEFDYLRPVIRDVSGEPILSLKKFIRYENVLGSSNTFLNSGYIFSSFTALYSPKGKNGLPQPLFDPYTGKIDSIVAQHWKKYDFKIFAQENWENLGPKLMGKIYIWMGDMDNYYLNSATRKFADFLKATKNPTSDAEIIFSPEEGHCWQYGHKDVLLKIQQRIEQINKGKSNGNKK